LVLQFNKFKRPAVATVWAEEALEISKRELGPKHDATLERQRRFAQTLNIDGQYDRAAELLKDAIERKSPQGDALYFGLLHDLSAIDYKLGRWSEAIPLTKQVVEYRERDLGADHPRTLATKHQLGLALSNLGRHEAATEVLQEVAAAVETAEGLSLANRLSMQSTPLVHQYRQGAYAEALSGFETLYPDFIEHLGPSHPQTITMQLSIASAQRALGRVDEAIDNLRDVIRKREEVLGPDHEHVWHAKLGLASALLAKGDFEQAVATAEPAVEWYIQQRGFGHHQAHRGSQTLAYALLALERFDEAHEVVARWQATDADVLPELQFSAELAAAEIALGRQNLGTARERRSAAAQYLASDETSADAAGLHSLDGVLALRAGKLTEAETELNAAKQILDTQSATLQAHQRFWADVVTRRLNEVRRQRADASPDA
ncbi:MAG: tetratricopeptide repeat protein, partial [Planctomycetota bacterium]